MPGIGVVVNPHARHNRTDAEAREQRMAGIVGSSGLVRLTPTLDVVEVDDLGSGEHRQANQ